MVHAKKIMVVDDDDASNFLCTRVIRNLDENSVILVFENGREAMNYLLDTCIASDFNPDICPDLILLDINMPVMDGFQFLEELSAFRQRLNNKVKVMLVTSSSNPADIKRADDFNIDGYINKPLTPDKIRKVLN